VRIALAVLAAVLLGASLPAADAAPPAIARWAFTPGGRLYIYKVDQQTSLATAGEQLHYAATFAWKIAVGAEAADITPDHVRLGATILAISATFDGPGSHHAFDTSSHDASALVDPLFAHLAALVDKPHFDIDCDPRTGAVSAVSGGETVAQTIAAHEPSAFDPGDPSPLLAPARAAYGSQALAELWSNLLALPTAGDQPVPLVGPVSGALVRRWSGLKWTLALPSGTDHLPLALGSGPLAVAGTLSGLSGAGAIAPRAGMPSAAQGEVDFTLTLTALTQPVTEQQRITWTMAEAPP
jgi:hypothetical protein